MIGSRRAPWAVFAGLAVLTAALIVAVVIARTERPSRGLLAATPGIEHASPGAAPEVAILNAQLAQIAAIHSATTYGVGLTHVVRSPVASLRPWLGEEWRELQGSAGTVSARPIGTPSRYVEVSLVAVAQRPARLAVVTSAGQHVTEPVSTGPYARINFGPLVAPPRGPIGLTFSSLQPNSNSPGPRLVLSPPQAHYLAPGEWVTGMPALAEFGPEGQRGLYLVRGSSTLIAMTAGLSGRSDLVLQGAGVGGPVQVAVTVGSEIRQALVGTRLTALRIGPFLNTSAVLSVAVSSAEAGSRGDLFVSHLGFVAP
jgi:hypothetical protein